MLSFSRPSVLVILLIAVPLVILARARFLSRTEFPLTLGDWGGVPFRWMATAMRIAAFVSRLAVAVSAVSAALALAGPVIFRQERVYSAPGATVVFVVDVSPSMAAGDMGNGNRLDAARRLMRAFVSSRSGDSFGLVALGSDAALLVPPTHDHAAFLERLAALRIGELGDGTALGLGLAVAAAHLQPGSGAHVILLTDGENNAGEINPKTAAAALPPRGAELHIIGIGTRGDVPIEYTDPETGKGYAGVLESGFDEGALRAIALSGGGTYRAASSPGLLEAIFTEIGEAVPRNPSSYACTVEEPIERPFIACALVAAALAWAIRRLAMGALL
ncbi:MAG TPA: VWA domain-containing protein [Treponemataceae bacterium]|nr:VWA domain-containing protein [Treponemataceae bacterium]